MLFIILTIFRALIPNDIFAYETAITAITYNVFCIVYIHFITKLNAYVCADIEVNDHF